MIDTLRADVTLDKLPELLALERIVELGGQRVSAGLPWYRGPKNEAMEIENQAVCDVAHAELLSRNFNLSVDCRSGFGSSNRIWFP